jgi:hypothetical protein
MYNLRALCDSLDAQLQANDYRGLERLQAAGFFSHVTEGLRSVHSS